MSAPGLLLLDLDGVLRRFGPDAPVEDAHGLPRGLLDEVARSVVGPALVGAETDARWREAVVGALVARGVDGEVAASAVTAWSGVGEVVPEALELVRAVRGRCRVALLANATDRVGADLAALGLDREVDAVVTSARVGVAKPDPEAFRRALRVLQHSASGTLFCDDSAVNVAGARSAGLDAAHTPDAAALRDALLSRGLLEGGTGADERERAGGPVLVVLHDRDEAEEVAAGLLADGWSPCLVHKELLAGEDDAEDADWVVEVESGPDGRAATVHRPFLDALAERHEGFTTD
ncbi:MULTISPECIES: HAD-IA family hydrolase [Actinosynnema]|uniref:HAD family hydrolase n=1 Tax=Actinosynnema TaxID=40566 RepID=UPI0020A40860|nr:HAD-IA family hydrolase [Actinosynnema pretiosum]MCP2095459.1 haloacid dehalogenase superfamily, subfamily IA, variant 3 with third motif having DD or ED [Actinosynnema pretiosum]